VWTQHMLKGGDVSVWGRTRPKVGRSGLGGVLFSGLWNLQVLSFKTLPCLALVAHFCNPSYLGG
jgi:hypothetical protein